MLQDLYMMSLYFNGPDAVLYEDDLRRRYGESVVLQAIRSGLLEHRRVPGGCGRRRCVCWLSEKGSQLASLIN